MGSGGFQSLLHRAMTLAQREAPALIGVKVLDDGSLEGFEGAAAEANPILVAHLVHLLNTFIGDSLTIVLLQDIWPMAGDPETHLEKDGHDA